MNPTFAILHATYGRPHKAIAAMEMWFARASRPKDVEYIFALNHDDPTHLCASDSGIAPRIKGGELRVRFVSGPFPGSAPAWNAAAEASTGEILIQAADDLIPPDRWDEKLMTKIADGHGIPPIIGPVVVAVSDGGRKDDLMTVAIMSRARYERLGHFLFPQYISLFSDDEHSYVTLRDARDGECELINARDIVFRHDHPVHNPSIPMDPTYLRSNSSEAYRIGSELFARRNPEAHRDGLRSWN